MRDYKDRPVLTGKTSLQKLIVHTANSGPYNVVLDYTDATPDESAEQGTVLFRGIEARSKRAVRNAAGTDRGIAAARIEAGSAIAPVFAADLVAYCSCELGATNRSGKDKAARTGTIASARAVFARRAIAKIRAAGGIAQGTWGDDAIMATGR